MTEPTEMTIPWSRVVESDQIWSEKTRKWYEVRGVVKQKMDGRIRVFAREIPKAFVRDPEAMVRVKRGPTGKAVDVFQIIFSGQTTRDIPESEK